MGLTLSPGGQGSYTEYSEGKFVSSPLINLFTTESFISICEALVATHVCILATREAEIRGSWFEASSGK
jgi:hypothetical protein